MNLRRIKFPGRFILLILLLLVIADRILVLHYFGFRYTGSDDMIFWQGARDYMKCIFHEPFFYGQNYNVMVEALAAAPLLATGINPEYVFPIVTSCMALLPWLAFSIACFLQNQKPASYIILCSLLLLPVDYGILTTMTRGFVSGIFILSFYPLTGFLKKENTRFLFYGIIFSAAVAVNANSLVLVIPLLIYQGITHFKSLKFYSLVLAGSLPFFLLNCLAKYFYKIHPENLLHQIGDWRLAFHPELITECFGKLNFMLAYLCPVFWNKGEFILLLLVLTAVILLLQKKYREAAAVVSGLIVIIFSFGFAKAQDATDSIFYCSSRMFLAAPLLAAIACTWIAGTPFRIKYVVWCIAASLVFLFIKMNVMEDTLNKQMQKDRGPVGVISIAELKPVCSDLYETAMAAKADLIVFIPGNDNRIPSLEFRNYGCDFYWKNFPFTLLSSYDRRTWRMHEEEKATRKNILFYGGDAAEWTRIEKEFPALVQVNNLNTLHLLPGNTVPAIDLLKSMKIQTRIY